MDQATRDFIIAELEERYLSYNRLIGITKNNQIRQIYQTNQTKLRITIEQLRTGQTDLEQKTAKK